MTICGPGLSDKTLEAGFYKLYLEFLAENNITIGVTPYAAAQLLKEWILFNSTECVADLD